MATVQTKLGGIEENNTIEVAIAVDIGHFFPIDARPRLPHLEAPGRPTLVLVNSGKGQTRDVDVHGIEIRHIAVHKGRGQDRHCDQLFRTADDHAVGSILRLNIDADEHFGNSKLGGMIRPRLAYFERRNRGRTDDLKLKNLYGPSCAK